jgi:hypothetical protein
MFGKSKEEQCGTCWDEAAGVSLTILAGVSFLFWHLKPIPGELVKTEHPLTNREIAQETTVSCQSLPSIPHHSIQEMRKDALIRQAFTPNDAQSHSG